jgi:hypothetical protein
MFMSEYITEEDMASLDMIKEYAFDGICHDIDVTEVLSLRHEPDDSFEDSDIRKMAEKLRSRKWHIIGHCWDGSLKAGSDGCCSAIVIEDENGDRFWDHAHGFLIHDWIQKARIIAYNAENGPFRIGFGHGGGRRGPSSTSYEWSDISKEGYLKSYLEDGSYEVTDDPNSAMIFHTSEKVDDVIRKIAKKYPEFVSDSAGQPIMYTIYNNGKWEL